MCSFLLNSDAAAATAPHCVIIATTSKTCKAASIIIIIVVVIFFKFDRKSMPHLPSADCLCWEMAIEKGVEFNYRQRTEKKQLLSQIGLLLSSI